jgi:hypothetical protein
MLGSLARVAALQPGAVADHDRRAAPGLCDRGVNNVGLGLALFDVGRCGVGVHELSRAEQLDVSLGFLLFGRADQDHGVTGPFQVTEQFVCVLHRLDFVDHLLIEGALGGAQRLADSMGVYAFVSSRSAAARTPARSFWARS